MMNKLTSYLILSCFFLFLTTGCGLAYKVLLGVDTHPEWETDGETARQAKKYKIPAEYNLLLDTVGYYRGLKEIYSSLAKGLTISESDSSAYFMLKKVLKDDTQPVQFRLFNKEGSEIFKIVNCYVDPPIRMDWNVEGCFDNFPPTIEEESLNFHYFDLDFLLTHASSMSQKKLSISDLPQADYYGVVLWNNFFQKPSRNLIKTARKKMTDSNQSVCLIYISNHNAYLWQAMDSKQKEEIKKWTQTEKKE